MTAVFANDPIKKMIHEGGRCYLCGNLPDYPVGQKGEKGICKNCVGRWYPGFSEDEMREFLLKQSDDLTEERARQSENNPNTIAYKNRMKEIQSSF